MAELAVRCERGAGDPVSPSDASVGTSQGRRRQKGDSPASGRLLYVRHVLACRSLGLTV